MVVFTLNKIGSLDKRFESIVMGISRSKFKIHSYVRNNLDSIDNVVSLDTNTFYDFHEEGSPEYFKIPQICLFPTSILADKVSTNKKLDFNSLRTSLRILNSDIQNIDRARKSEIEKSIRDIIKKHALTPTTTKEQAETILNEIKIVLGNYKFYIPKSCIATYNLDSEMIHLKPNEVANLDTIFTMKKGNTLLGKVEILINCASHKDEYCLDFGTDAIQIYRGQQYTDIKETAINILPIMAAWYGINHKEKNTKFEQVLDFDRQFYKNIIFYKGDSDPLVKIDEVWKKPSKYQEIDFCTVQKNISEKDSAPTLIPSLKLLYNPNIQADYGIDNNQIPRFYQMALMNMIWVCIEDLKKQHIEEDRYLKLHVLLPNVYGEDKIFSVIQDINKNLKSIKEAYPDSLMGFEVRPLSESDAAYIGVMKKENAKKRKSNFDLLIDCGKGTTDISIFKLDGSNFYSLSKSGFTGAGNLLTIGVMLDILESSIKNNAKQIQEILNYIHTEPDKFYGSQLMLAAEKIKRNLDDDSIGMIPELTKANIEDSDDIGELVEKIIRNLGSHHIDVKPEIKHFSIYIDKLVKSICDSIHEILLTLNLKISEIGIIYLMGRSFKSELFSQSFKKQLKIEFPASKYTISGNYPEIIKHPYPKTTVAKVFNKRMHLSENLNIVHTPLILK